MECEDDDERLPWGTATAGVLDSVATAAAAR
jgi:hypothetical protein